MTQRIGCRLHQAQLVRTFRTGSFNFPYQLYPYRLLKLTLADNTCCAMAFTPSNSPPLNVAAWARSVDSISSSWVDAARPCSALLRLSRTSFADCGCFALGGSISVLLALGGIPLQKANAMLCLLRVNTSSVTFSS